MTIYSLLFENINNIKIKISPEFAALIEADKKALEFVSQQISLLMTGSEEEKEAANKFLTEYYGDMFREEDEVAKAVNA
jgi:hypothetical protein